MNREQQENARIKAMVMAMTGSEHIETFVRTNAVRDLTADEVRNALTKIARHAFGQGMTSIFNNPDPAYTPEMRVMDYLNKRPDKARN